MQNLSKLTTLIKIILINEIIICSSIYVSIVTPPKRANQTAQLINIHNRSNLTELDCEPLSTEMPPTIVIDFNKKPKKKLPPCPPLSFAPKFDGKSLKNITVISGETVIQDLTYSGYPEPTIEYYKIDAKLHETDRIKTLKKFVIMNATRDIDQGIYTVIATNTKGQDLVEFYVKVLERPSPPVGPLNAVLNSPTTITLSWSPPVETNNENITQYIIERLVLNDEWIHFLNTSKTNKTIANLNVREIYKFRVRAVNKYGISDPLVMNLGIKTRGEPSMPRDIRTVVVNGLVQIEWKAPKRDNGEPITSYLVERREIPNGRWVLVVKTNADQLKATEPNVKPDRIYEFRVTAINDFGKSDPSKPSQPVFIKL